MAVGSRSLHGWVGLGILAWNVCGDFLRKFAVDEVVEVLQREDFIFVSETQTRRA